jgi:hypothetical protein
VLTFSPFGCIINTDRTTEINPQGGNTMNAYMNLVNMNTMAQGGEVAVVVAAACTVAIVVAMVVVIIKTWIW